ncbi:hypothetical protein CCHL11_02072 [Colletotrichum chlorophyti]|uniref:Uncharacterized protein n=1 Tax=Colletotrichum chlorophyti TaxID=708187 RepID=A0A1Q8S6D7_9PEZI|nr:hypothetical protein CCHL11_02072 [Colletotrichum chlorophyti]
MQVQDDLATLFSRNLTFNPEAQNAVQTAKAEEEPGQPAVPNPTDAAQTPAASAPPLIYSISQHYNHSAHIARRTEQPVQETQRPSSEPPNSDIDVGVVLRLQGVNPEILSQSQLELYRVSNIDDQNRLVNIWLAAPPTSSMENPSLAWTTTTLEQEERLGKLRYERMEQEKQLQQQIQEEQRLHQLQQEQQNAVMSLDGTQVQSNDGRWLASSISNHVEPYMMSGYEQMMRREYEREQLEARSTGNYSHYGSAVGSNASTYKPAIDPVYKGFGDDWAREQQMQMRMENQYGAFQQYGGPSGNVDAMEM